MHQHRFARRSFRAEPDEIDELQYAERVDHKKRDEPPFLARARSVPERISLQDDGPEDDDKHQWDKNTHPLRCERGVKRRVCLHMFAAYHTLYIYAVSRSG